MESGKRVPWGPELSAQQRMEVAHLTGATNRWTYGDLKGRPDDERRAALLGITRDPLVWGVLLGGALADLEVKGWTHAQRIVDLCRSVGADEDAAAVHLRWRRRLPGP